MRKPLGLTLILRSAALKALAAAVCTAPAAACGGSIEALGNPSDAGNPGDAADQPDEGTDAAVPSDAGHDTGSPTDASHDGDTHDASTPPDSGCVPTGPQNQCAMVGYTCIPPGMVVGYNQAPACTVPCGAQNFGCQVFVADAGDVSIECLCGGGRFPAGLMLVARRGRRGGGAQGDALGSVLARNAALETAAVRAFEQLARELADHGAPRELVARTRRAARDEVTHARLLRRAAAARGCTVPRTRARPTPATTRSLRDIAVENAVEGCGREALGAALLELQSRRCPDPELSSILARIAADEMVHAELAWDLHAWLLSRLDARARAEVVAAHEAFLDLCEQHAPPELSDAHVASGLGMPSRPQWNVLVSAVRWGLRWGGVAA
ncbi:MAG TPA: ferritin-like domain-containing protein [Polyangiaceae bacterium]|jgi:hypothetical protein